MIRRFLLGVLLALAASPAFAVCGTGAGGCFWVGGTGTWDNSTTTHWASSSGGAGSVAVPISTSTVTFDGSSGGGTVTVAATFNASNTLASITMGAFTGTIDFSANNPNVTLTTFSGSGTGARTINLGNGTWTLTGTNGNIWDITTATSLTLNANSSTLLVQAASCTNTRNMMMGAQTYNIITLTQTGFCQSARYINFSNAGSWSAASMTVTNIGGIQWQNGGTVTFSGAFTINSGGSSTVPFMMFPSNGGPTTISVGSASTINWGIISGITASGAGSITATNSFDGGGNTSVTITAPSGAGSHCIGC